MNKIFDITTESRSDTDKVFNLLNMEIEVIEEMFKKGYFNSTNDIFKNKRSINIIKNIESILTDRFGIRVVLKPSENDDCKSEIKVPGIELEIDNFIKKNSSIMKYLKSNNKDADEILRVRDAISRSGVRVKDDKVIGVNKTNSIVLYLDIYDFFKDLKLEPSNISHILVAATEQAINELLRIYHVAEVSAELKKGLDNSKDKKDLKSILKKHGIVVTSDGGIKMFTETLKGYVDKVKKDDFKKINIIGEDNYVDYGLSNFDGGYVIVESFKAIIMFTGLIMFKLFFFFGPMGIVLLPVFLGVIVTVFVAYLIFFSLVSLIRGDTVKDKKSDDEKTSNTIYGKFLGMINTAKNDSDVKGFSNKINSNNPFNSFDKYLKTIKL